MKMTIATIALGLAGLTFAQTPAPTTQAPAEKPAATSKAKHHQKAKKTKKSKTTNSSATPAASPAKK